MEDFRRHVLSQQRVKVLLLVGYTVELIGEEDDRSLTTTTTTDEVGPEATPPPPRIRNGDDAASILQRVLASELVGAAGDSSNGSDINATRSALSSSSSLPPSSPSSSLEDLRLIRAYGHTSRGTDVAAQDNRTGALTELFAVRLPPLRSHEEDQDQDHHQQQQNKKESSPTAGGAGTVQEWIDDMNRKLQVALRPARTSEQASTPAMADASSAQICTIWILGRQDLPPSARKFSPEMDFSHRRIEFVIPMDFFWQPPSSIHNDPLLVPDSNSINRTPTMVEFFRQIFSFDDVANPDDDPVEGDPPVVQQQHYCRTDESLLGVERPSRDVLLYMHSLKKKMQMLTTQVEKLTIDSDSSARKLKEYSQQKRQNVRVHQSQRRDANKRNNKNNHNRKRPMEGEGESDDSFLVESSGLKDFQFDSVFDGTGRGEGINDSGCNDHDDTSCNGNGNNEHPKKSRNRGNKGTHVLRRKRFHNFTPFVMAHEFLAFRRLDRFYHRATLRFHQERNEFGIDRVRLLGSRTKDMSSRPFLVLSLSGDLFLTGQAPRLVGLFLAMATGAIDTDIVECVFDEKYPHLVPTPPAPLFAMYAGEAFYTKWEGKLKTIFTPRRADHLSAGWNDPGTLRRVQEWTNLVRERTALAWMQGGVVEEGGDERLASVRRWIENVLEPWATRAREQLKDYRQWKASAGGASGVVVGDLDAEPAGSFVEGPASATSRHEHESGPIVPLGTANLPSLKFVDPSVPSLYEKVLFYLRQADASGLWPSTTPKRQLVMISTVREGCKDQGDPATATSLAEALERAHSSQAIESSSRSSAYIFEEGQGGASGSFSVGAMPDGQNAQPRANHVFPRLMKAAFELEIALRPDREPSSTIAINRNAQFRPHLDSGAGAGQSTSLIVGLGTYAGGELVVEGELKDIRYKAIEFNGWKQRHWTMPFTGERFSLVWFTPKGCEGVRGIDLCKDIVLD
jgi:hypothetical protein